MRASARSIGTARVYRMNAFQRIFSVVFSAFSTIFMFAIWYGVLPGTRQLNFMEMMGSVVLVIAGVLFAIRAFKNSVRLWGDFVEYRSIVGVAILPFDKIKGRRRYLDQGDADSPSVWHLVMEPNDDRFPKIDIQETYQFDQSFYHWFNALSDLDELDKTKPKPSNFGLV
jgi:hypothetical protein